MTLQNPICTDDFGTSVYRCRYTGVVIYPDSMAFVGTIVPGVKGVYYIANSKDAKDAHKESILSFHESDANCNTCSFLERVPHEKRSDGFLFGKCKNPNNNLSQNPYFFGKEVFQFHPDDWMGMSCYEPRRKL